MKTLKLSFLATALSLTISMLAQAATQEKSCKELSKMGYSLVTCTDQGHTFDEVRVSYQVLPLNNCRSVASAMIEIVTGEGPTKQYSLDVIYLSDLERFLTSVDSPLTVAAHALPAHVNEFDESIEGGVMIRLNRIYDDPEPRVVAQLLVGGRMYPGLNCKLNAKLK